MVQAASAELVVPAELVALEELAVRVVRVEWVVPEGTAVVPRNCRPVAIAPTGSTIPSTGVARLIAIAPRRTGSAARRAEIRSPGARRARVSRSAAAEPARGTSAETGPGPLAAGA